MFYIRVWYLNGFEKRLFIALFSTNFWKNRFVNCFSERFNVYFHLLIDFVFITVEKKKQMTLSYTIL